MTRRHTISFSRRLNKEGTACQIEKERPLSVLIRKERPALEGSNVPSYPGKYWTAISNDNIGVGMGQCPCIIASDELFWDTSAPVASLTAPTCRCHDDHDDHHPLIYFPFTNQQQLYFRSTRSYKWFVVHTIDISEYRHQRFVPPTLAPMPSLKKWLRNNLPWINSTPSEPIPDPLPFLPIQRPSTLTPSPSTEALVSSTDSYGYFQHLPYEIRRQILTEALGGRTLHMDLTYRNRPIRKKGKYIIGKDGGYAYAKSKTWGWYSCECHQTDSLWPDGIARRNFGEERWITNQRKLPCAGGCKDGRNHRKCGPEVDDKQPLKCRVNAMGWLLACRQAYVISFANPCPILYGKYR